MPLDLQITQAEHGPVPRALPAHGPGGLVWRQRPEVLRLVAAHGGTGIAVFRIAARGDDQSDSAADLLGDLRCALTERLQALLGACVDVVAERSVKPAVRARIDHAGGEWAASTTVGGWSSGRHGQDS